MKKRFIFFVLLAFLVVGVFPLSPLTPAANAQDGIEWQCPEDFSGQTLNIFNWSLYIGEETIPTFEKLCDVTVNYDVYDTADVMLTRLREGNPGYDVVFMSDYMTQAMIEEGYLEPLDFSLLPNFENISEQFTGLFFDPENEYSVPYLWGTTALTYNINRVDDEVTSWADMFEYDGPVAWLDEPPDIIAIGLLMTGNPPNPENEEQIEEARDYLIEHGDNVRAIESINLIQLMETGEVDMAIMYSGEAYQLIEACECDDFEYVIPVEGANIYIDSVSIPTGARNTRLAHAFIDYLMDPYVAAEISNTVIYASPNKKVEELGLIDPEIRENPAIYLEPEVIERLFFIQNNPDLEIAILDAWDEIILSVGY
ncbi:MAG: hypothetical protein CUN55_08580 [Phototrophicales bacterium]|nr:MAG: hypothetical protein CUN55_08580 [Phototrophicales bacterium]